jgi:hypothetical protein
MGRFHRAAIRVAVLLPLAAVACKGGLVSGFPPVVDTLPDRAQVRAGEVLHIACTVADDAGRPVDTATTVVVDPVEGLALADHDATPTKAGAYAATCAAPEFDVADETPAAFTVVPADPAKATATVDPAAVQAGQPATVTCVVEDAYGNVIADAPTTVVADAGVDVDGHRVSASTTGNYEVACRVAGFQVVEVPDVLTVGAADPVRVELYVKPDKPRYELDALITLSHKVFDAYDNVVEGLPFKYVIPAKGVKKTAPDKIRLNAEGHHVVKVVLDAPWQAIQDSRTLVCDQSGPIIEDLYPPRGHTTDDEAVLVVSGRAVDLAGSKVAEVKVNGKVATLQADGSFEMPVDSVHGMNGLKITAKDEHGLSAYTTRGYYYSQGWLEAGPETTVADATFPEGAMLFLGQRALDDGDHDPARLNDFATILEVLLGLDLVDLIGGIPPFGTTLPNVINLTLLGVGLQGDLEVQVTVTNVSLGTPHVSLDTRDGGMAAGIAFDNVALGLDLEFYVHARAIAFGNQYPLLDPGVATSSAMRVGRLGVSVSLDIDMPLGGDLAVEGRDFQLEITDVEIDPIAGLIIDLGKVPGLGIDLGTYDLSQLVGPINDLLRDYVLGPLINFITQPLIDLLEPLVVPLIGDAIAQVLGLLDIEQTIQIPSILGTPPIDLDLAVSLSSVQFTEDGGRLGLDLGVLTDHVVPHQPLGSMLRADCNGADPDPAMFDFGAEPGIQAGLRLDLVNELLFMLWRAGLINQTFDLGGLLGGGGGISIDGLIVTPNAYLPPVLNDCGEMQELQIGDLYLDVQGEVFGFSLMLQVWLQLKMEANVFATGDEIGLKIGKVRFLETEIYDASGGMGGILDMVLPMIPDLIKNLENQQFSFPIPAIPLDGVLPGLPAGAELKIGDLKAGTEHGVIVIGGNLQ